MRRLTDSQRIELENRLECWMPPIEMGAIVEEAVKSIGSEVFFRQPGLAFLRDAWIAAKFGRKIGAANARLVADQWPDFEFEIDGQRHQYEAVEVDDPQRRRGEEYRQGLETDDPCEEWVRRGDSLPCWIKAEVDKKVRKHYASGANLVVYVNPHEFGVRHLQVVQSFPSATAAARDVFNEVWVLWKRQAYKVW